MRKIISLICLLLPLLATADVLQVREDAPDRYVVVKGDTLWDISARFFSDPWKWPQIWGLNKESIKDPHWIYPGDVVYLDRRTGQLSINEPVIAPPPTELVKLEPQIRVVAKNTEAIPVIPLNIVAPFLQRPLVVENESLDLAPKLVGTYEQRTLLSASDVAYAQNLPANQGLQWQVYRPSIKFIDPDTGEMLGQEVLYLGDATVEKFGDPSTLRITKAILEINKGDYFAMATSGFSADFLPHAPSDKVNAKVISIYGGVQRAGQYSVITLNRGKREGVEIGHVLALFQKGETIKSNSLFSPNIVLPDTRYGLAMVFRVFDKVSYALVLETKLPVQVLDSAHNPE